MYVENVTIRNIFLPLGLLPLLDIIIGKWRENKSRNVLDTESGMKRQIMKM